MKLLSLAAGARMEQMDAMRYVVAVVGFCTLVACEEEPPARAPVFAPDTIAYEDGKPAYMGGPFVSRMSARRMVGEFCKTGYDVLDEEDMASTETTGRDHAVRVYGTTIVKRGDASTTSHRIRVLFRCRNVSDGGTEVDGGGENG